MAKILIIDEDEHIRLLYREELTEAGNKVSTMESPLGLSERIEKERPDILMFGVRLMGYDWAEVMRDVSERCPGISIIFNTRLSNLWDRARALGAAECFEKSFDPGKLNGIINKLMAERE